MSPRPSQHAAALPAPHHHRRGPQPRLAPLALDVHRRQLAGQPGRRPRGGRPKRVQPGLQVRSSTKGGPPQQLRRLPSRGEVSSSLRLTSRRPAAALLSLLQGQGEGPGHAGRRPGAGLGAHRGGRDAEARLPADHGARRGRAGALRARRLRCAALCPSLALGHLVDELLWAEVPPAAQATFGQQAYHQQLPSPFPSSSCCCPPG